MLATWRSIGDLAVERLDPGFYAPHFRRCVEAITRHGRRRLVSVAEKVVDHSFLQVRTEDYVEVGVPFMRVTDLGDMLLKTDKLIYITEEAHKNEANTIFHPGDVLVSKTGKVAVSIVPPTIPECNTSQDVMGIVVKAGVDPYYLTAFLGSDSGICQQQRWVQGPVQPHLSLGNLRRLFIFMPDPAIQRTIGNKVRKAERLRELATASMAAADSAIGAASFTDLGPKVSARPRWFDSDVFSPVSWDAEFNRTKEAQARLNGVVPFRDLLAECRAGDPIASSDRRPGPYRYYGASGPIDWHDEWNTEGDRILVAQDGTIGVALVASGKYWANNHVWICRLKPDYSHRAVARFMTCFYPFWEGLRTGSVVPKVTSENLERLCVPIAVATAIDVGILLEKAEANDAQAKAQIDAARAAVESLIDGTLDEAALLAESEAIEHWLAENPSPHETEKP